MEDERLYKLFTLVLLCRNQDEYLVWFEVHRDYETINIYSEGDFWRYSTDCLDSFEDKLDEQVILHGVHDDNLKQAEDHILKILKVKEA